MRNSFFILFVLALASLGSRAAGVTPDSIVSVDRDGNYLRKTTFEGDAGSAVMTTAQWEDGWRTAERQTTVSDGNTRTVSVMCGGVLSQKNITKTDEQGRTTYCEQCAYDGKGNITAGEKSDYYYISLASSETVERHLWQYDTAKGQWIDTQRTKVVIQFNAQGFNTSTTTYLWTDNAGWQQQRKEEFSYNEEGRPQSVYVTENGGQRYLFSEYEFDDESHTTKLYERLPEDASRTFLHTVHTAFRSADGKETAYVTQEFDAQQRQVSANTVYDFYDIKGLSQEQIHKSIPQEGGGVAHKYQFLYDAYENVSARMLYTLDEQTQAWTHTSTDYYFYRHTPDKIEAVSDGEPSALQFHGSPLPYNIAGQRVADGYKGIVIQNGKKTLHF